MYEFSVILENETGSRLHPISVEEGVRRNPELDDAAGFAVVEGELHVRHCGEGSTDVRILRKGRVRAIRPGQSYRMMPGDSLCVANRVYHVREVYRKERPKRSSLGMTARSLALGAAAIAMSCSSAGSTPATQNPSNIQCKQVQCATQQSSEDANLTEEDLDMVKYYTRMGCCSMNPEKILKDQDEVGREKMVSDVE